MLVQIRLPHFEGYPLLIKAKESSDEEGTPLETCQLNRCRWRDPEPKNMCSGLSDIVFDDLNELVIHR